jgi:hypothetical protein
MCVAVRYQEAHQQVGGRPLPRPRCCSRKSCPLCTLHCSDCGSMQLSLEHKEVQVV